MKPWIALTLLAAACAAPRPAVPDAFVVASDLDNAPFAYVDGNGEPAGRDVEMMRMLSERCGITLEWRRMPFDELLEACERGEVDVVCATLGITAERAERVLFTRPYFETVIAVVVRTGAGEPIDLADLAGLRVSAAAGTTSELAVRSQMPAAVGVYENKEGLGAAERLLSRMVDGLVMDGPAADALVSANPGRLRRLDEVLAAERYALALPRGREALSEKLDAALRDLADEWPALDARHGLGSALIHK